MKFIINKFQIVSVLAKVQGLTGRRSRFGIIFASMTFRIMSCTIRVLRALVVSHARERLKKVMIFERADGGGKSPNIKSVVCIGVMTLMRIARRKVEDEITYDG